MDKRLRPIPFPWPTEWWKEYRRCKATYKDWPHYWIVNHIRVMNWMWRYRVGNSLCGRKVVRGEKCGAKTRKGTPCQAPAMTNGRCKLHGGLSTGAKTPEGKARALANLKQYRNSPPPSENQD